MAIWRKTMELRNVLDHDNGGIVLQQMSIDEVGNTKWEEIPLVNILYKRGQPKNIQVQWMGNPMDKIEPEETIENEAWMDRIPEPFTTQGLIRHDILSEYVDITASQLKDLYPESIWGKSKTIAMLKFGCTSEQLKGTGPWNDELAEYVSKYLHHEGIAELRAERDILNDDNTPLS